MADPLPLVQPTPLETRRRGPGGGERPPRDRRQHGGRLREELEAVETQLPEEDDEPDFSVVLKLRAEARLPTGPFRKLSLEALGETADWTYFVLSPRTAREALREVLSAYTDFTDESWDHPKSWAELLDGIEGIELYGAEDRRDPELDINFAGTQTVDVHLWPAPTSARAERRLQELTQAITEAAERQQQARLVAIDPRPETLSVRAIVDGTTLRDLLDLAVVERVRPPLRPLMTAADILSAAPPLQPPAPDGAPVGIIDDLVLSANPLLTRVVAAQQNIPNNYGFSNPTSHATEVASLAAYGSLDDFVATGTLASPHPVYVARVLDATARGDTEMVGQPHQTFEEAVRWLADQGVRVINCSINYRTVADTPIPDPFTVTVDILARELDLAIVVSSGNLVDIGTGHWLNDYPGYLDDPAAKVAVPGDAAIGVTVGSVAARDVPGGAGSGATTHLTAIARAEHPSPFTRTGPTRGRTSTGCAKPEFVAYGGNWAWDALTNRPLTRDFGIASVVAAPPSTGRVLGVDSGTSLAAPLVTHELAAIATRHPTASANLWRALLALSARHPVGAAPGSNAALVSAYGRPQAGRVLESGGPRVLLTYEGSIESGGATVFQIPIPREFVGGGIRRTLRVALAFDPPVRRARREYIAGFMGFDIVRGMSLDEIRARYERQPTLAEAEADSSLHRLALPDEDYRPKLTPGPRRLASNTVLRRELLDDTGWVDRHLNTYLIVTHDHCPSTDKQKREYPEQTFAVVVELVDEEQSHLDLHAAVAARLQARARVR